MFFQFFNSNIGYVCMRYLRPYHPVVIAVVDVLCFDKSTVFRWLAKHEDFRDKYAKATEARADSIFEEIFEIADNAIPDAAEVAKARLRVDTRKWALARMNPRKYGDKVTNELVGKDGGAIQIETSPMSTLFGK